MRSNENKFLSQILKNIFVESKVKLKKENGDINTKTLIITYRKEYEKTKFNRDNVKVLFIKPSIEKIFKELVLIDILVLIFVINSEKQIFLLNKDSPKFLIAREILEFNSKISFTKKNEKFMLIPNIINLKIKLKGVSVLVYIKCANK